MIRAWGAVMFVPRGTPHSFRNARPERARYVLVMTPRTHRLIGALHGQGPNERDFAAIFRAHASELLTP